MLKTRINPLTSPAALPDSDTELAAARAAILGSIPTRKRVAIQPLLVQPAQPAAAPRVHGPTEPRAGAAPCVDGARRLPEAGG